MERSLILDHLMDLVEIERRRHAPDAGNGSRLPRAFKTPFVGRRLRVSELFFWGHRFRPVVMLSPGGDIQFHPHYEIKKLSLFFWFAASKISHPSRKIIPLAHLNQNLI